MVQAAFFFMMLTAFAATPQALAMAAGTDGVEAPPTEMLKLRDPFRHPESKSELVPRTELEMYPLDQIKMMGVVTGPDHMRAMITTPNGKTHFIAERTKLGIHKGVVTKITPERVRIREKVVNVLGQEEDVESELQLPPDMRGGSAASLGATKK